MTARMLELRRFSRMMLGISTNVLNQDGSRAIGTRIMANVYDQVVIKGQSYVGRAYVVNNWYITAYEPIKDAQTKS